MAWFILVSGILGSAFVTIHQDRINPPLSAFLNRLLLRIRSYFQPNQSQSMELQLINQLIASTRAGVSLNASLERILANKALPDRDRNHVRSILEGKPMDGFLSSFLFSALKTGTPILSSLQLFQRALRTQARIKLKARAITSQCRAQAEVLSWLPLILMFAMPLVDEQWFASASKSSAFWLCLGASGIFMGIGRLWIKKILITALEPSSKADTLVEKILPELSLRIIGEVSLGKDLESSLENGIEALKVNWFSAFFHSSGLSDPPSLYLRSILDNSLRSGTPIREELIQFLNDLYLQAESRWEEKTQRLPILMLAPLFLCFFPSCLLIILGSFLPIMGELL